MMKISMGNNKEKKSNNFSIKTNKKTFKHNTY